MSSLASASRATQTITVRADPASWSSSVVIGALGTLAICWKGGPAIDWIDIAEKEFARRRSWNSSSPRPRQ